MKTPEHKSLNEAIKLTVVNNSNYDAYNGVFKKHGYYSGGIANDKELNPFASNTTLYTHKDGVHWVNKTDNGGWEHHDLYHPELDKRDEAGEKNASLVKSGSSPKELDNHLTDYHKDDNKIVKL